MADIPLQFPQIGNALAQGAHAGYFMAEARQKADEETRRQQAQPFIQGAMQGDNAAFGNVAAKDPKTALVISQALQRMDANKLAHTKAAAEYSASAAHAILQANPAERPALYAQLYAQGKAQGYDLSGMPDTYSPALEGRLRSVREMGLGVKTSLQLEEKRREEEGRNNRHFTHGGGTVGGEFLEPAPGAPPAPAPPLPAPTPNAGGRVSEVTPGVAVPSQAPTSTAAVAPPQPVVQTAQAMPGTASGSITATNQTAGQPNGPLKPDAVGVGAPPVGEPPAAPASPPGFEPMGHRDSSGTLVPALIDGKPVYRNPQTGEMRLGEAKEDRGLNAPPDLKQPSQVPQGPPQAAAPELRSGQIVYEDPALQGGRRVLRAMPNGKAEPVTGVGETHQYQLPNGTRVFYNPHLKRPIDANGLPSDVGDLHGDDFRATPFYRALPFTDRNAAEGLVDGSIPISTFAKRGGSGAGGVGGLPLNTIVGIAKQLDPKWSPNEGEQGKRFAASLVGNGQNAQSVVAMNTVPLHAADLVKLTDAMNQNNPKLIQELVNKVKDQFGDKNIPDVNAARFVTAIELLKASMGPNALNVEVEREAQKLLAVGNTGQQMRQVVSGWVNKVVERGHVLQDTADTYHLKDKIIRPRTEDAIKFLQGEPGTTPSPNYPAIPQREPSLLDRGKALFEGKQPQVPKLGANGEGYDSIPVGGQYIAPDGSTRTKGGK